MIEEATIDQRSPSRRGHSAADALAREIAALAQGETGLVALARLGEDAGDEVRRIAQAHDLPAGHPARALFTPGITHLSLLPIIANGRRRGAVYLACPEGVGHSLLALASLAERITTLFEARLNGQGELARRTALQTLLTEAADILLDARDLSATIEALCKRAAGVLGDGITVTLLNRAGDGYTLVAAAHTDPAIAEQLRAAASIFPGASGSSAAARRYQQVIVADPADETNIAPTRWPILQRAGLKRAISVPLRGAGDSSGNLVVYATGARTRLDRTTIQIATILGDRIGDVLTRHELLETAKQQAASLEALLRSAQVVAQQRNSEATLGAIASELERIIPVDIVTIWGLDPVDGSLHPRVAHYSDSIPWMAPPPLARGTGLASTVIETRQPAYHPEAHRHPRSVYMTEGRAQAAEHGESAMVAPLLAGDEVLGVLAVSRLGVDRFTADEFRVFRLFAEQAAIALQQVVALAREQRRRQQAERLAALGEEIARAPSIGVILDTAARGAATLLGCERAWVGLRDPERRAVANTAVFPAGSVMLALFERQVPAGAGVWPASGLTAPRVIDDLKAIPQAVIGRARQLGLRNAAVAPLLVGDVDLGAILVWDADRAHTFLPEDLEALGTFARQTASLLAAARADESLATQLRTNTMLRRAAEISLSAQGDAEAAAAFAGLLADALEATFASIWLLNPGGDRLHLQVIAGRGTGPLTLFPRAEIALADGGRVVDTVRLGTTTIVPAPHQASLDPVTRQQCATLRTAGLVLLPISGPGGHIGVVRLDFGVGVLPGTEALTLGEAITRQLGVGLESLRLRQRWRVLYRSSVEALAATVDARDPFTHTHSRNVALYSRVIAERLGLSQQQVEQIELAGLLHDIGKIGIADRILTKTGPLDPDERMVMMTHPTRGAQILAGHDDLAALVPIVCHHHERWDGFGYPAGLTGEEIPLGASIVCVADAFDTMVSDRSYARRRPVTAALRELADGAGTQFRPDVAAALCAAVEADPGLVRPPLPDSTAPGVSRQTGRLPAGEVAQARILARLAHELGALVDLSTFIERSRQIVATELGYPSVEILLWNATGQHLMAAGARPVAPQDEPRLGVCLRIAAQAVASNRIINVPDLALYPEGPAVTGDVRAALAVSLWIDGTPLGALCVTDTRRNAFSLMDEELMTAAADQLAAALRVAQMHDEVKQAARHDGLTAALNHRAFYDELGRAIAAHQRTGAPASLILCDVEGLKRVNDELGHLVGDRLLKSLVARIRTIVRPDAAVARYGGDEFAVICYGTSREEAEAIGRQLRASLVEEPLLAEEPAILVTIGVAQVGEDGNSPVGLVSAADSRLYLARGRKTTRAL